MTHDIFWVCFLLAVWLAALLAVDWLYGRWQAFKDDRRIARRVRGLAQWRQTRYRGRP